MRQSTVGRWALVAFMVFVLAGCALSGRGAFLMPVWIWECWWDKTLLCN